MRRSWAAGIVLTFALSTSFLAQAEEPVPALTPPAAPAQVVLPSTITSAEGISIAEPHPEIGAAAFDDGSGNRFYVSAEYLLWWIKNPKNPVLVTTGPSFPVGTINTNVASLGAPGTVVLNSGTVNYDPDSGFRITAGIWLDDCHHKALETTYFFLGPQNKPFDDNTGVNPVIARPFFDQSLGIEDAELTAGPGLATGSIAVRNSQRLWGLEENLRCRLCCGCRSHLDLLVGARYVELDEGLSITENVIIGPAALVPPPGSHGTVYDSFSTRNQFFGGQLGLDYEEHWGNWFLDTRGKVALGNTHEILTIVGNQTLTVPGGPTTTFNGGLLALPSNIGVYHRDRFTVMPELTLNLGYQFTDNIRAYIGYTFLYWSRILNPGEQIDRVLNPNQIPNFPVFPAVTGPSHPLVPFKQNDFWVQGLNFGLEFQF